MEITQEQYQLIADTFPKPRGNIKISNPDALNGILYILEHGSRMAGATPTVREPGTPSTCGSAAGPKAESSPRCSNAYNKNNSST